MKTTLLISSFFMIGFSSLFSAQESLNTAGINLAATSGSITSSIGQNFYDTASSATGSVSAGVQQAYEITETLGIDIKEIELSLSIYPNPTTDILNLKVGFKDFQKYRYDIVDNSGKILKGQAITQEKTSVSMMSYPAAVYYIKISRGTKAIKIFKVLKTDK